jgi:hypothetical protein
MPKLTPPTAEIERLIAECPEELFDRIGPEQPYRHFADMYERALHAQWELIGREDSATGRRSEQCVAALALGVIRRRWPKAFGPVIAFDAFKTEAPAAQAFEWPKPTVSVSYDQSQAA